MTAYLCPACRVREVSRKECRCNPCRGLAVKRAPTVSELLRYAARLREAYANRARNGFTCRDCGEVCIGIEDCVSRIAAAIRRARVAA